MSISMQGPEAQSLCSGKNCIVVGSAPGRVLPEKREGDVVIGVNNAAIWAQKSGYPVDIFYSIASMFARKFGAKNKLLKGLVASRAVLWHADFQVSLADFGITVGETHYLTRQEGLHMVMNICGYPLWVSSGIGAACLALQGGAKSVKMVGFSLSDFRHADIPRRFSRRVYRDHVLEDGNFLTAIKATSYGGLFHAT